MNTLEMAKKDLPGESIPKSGGEILLIEKGSVTARIPVKNILFVRSEHVYCRIYFVNDQRLLQRISLESLLTKLPEDKFLQVHRSCAINVDFVRSFNSSRVFLGEVEIPIGRTWRVEAVARLRAIYGK